MEYCPNCLLTTYIVTTAWVDIYFAYMFNNKTHNNQIISNFIKIML